MIPFFISSAVLVVIVLLLLLPVFFRRADSAEPNRTDINVDIAKAQAQELRQRRDSGEISEQDYSDEKVRLEAELARDIEKEEVSAVNAKGRWMLWPIAAVVPVAAGALYLSLGTPEALDPASYIVPPAAATESQPPDMPEILAGIRQQVKDNPEDWYAWYMLGRAHYTLAEYPQAEDAWRKSAAIDGSDVVVKIRLADVLAATSDGSFAGEPEALLAEVIEAQPDNPEGLWLYGMALNQTGQYKNAVAVWQRLLPQVANEPQLKGQLEQLIADANAQLPESDRLAATTQSEVVATNVDAAGGLTVTVGVAPGLADNLSADTAVFIYAKASVGPPMPLAVVKHALGELPITVKLTDEQAMMASMKLSAFEEVVVGARISKTGDPIAKSGDLFIESGNVKPRELSGGIELTISGVVP